jgi:hypothetical protein
MRIFKGPVEAYQEIERELFEMGIRVHSHSMQDKVVEGNEDFDTMELMGYGYQISNTDSPEDEDAKGILELAKLPLVYLEQEHQDRVNPNYLNPGLAWITRPEIWKPFLRDNTFSYTYNERFREQLPMVIAELTKRPYTRQAIMTMYDRHQDMRNWGGRDRIPCSLTYQFMRRPNPLNQKGDVLHLIYTMRSCDFITHFPYDMMLTIKLLRHVAILLGIKPGIFTHFMGSLHAYKKDLAGKGIF